MGTNENTLNEIEQEMMCYLLNVDEMNYTMLCEPVIFGSKSNYMSELDEQRCSYLLNLDDMNYTMLCEPLVTRYKSAMTPDMPNFVRLEKLSLIDEIIGKEDSHESVELIDIQRQSEFPKRKFHPLRPATMEDEVAEDPSYSE
jgi:hypothetical protein